MPNIGDWVLTYIPSSFILYVAQTCCDVGGEAKWHDSWGEVVLWQEIEGPAL